MSTSPLSPFNKAIIFSAGIILFLILTRSNQWPAPSQLLVPSFSDQNTSFYINRPTVQIGSTIISVETVATPEQQRKGLSGKTSLLDEQGMLFIFSKPGMYGFWMKGMLFPIDIIWIQNGKILAIEKNVAPEPNATNLKTFYPPTPVTEVLEVNAGFAKARGFKEGDEVVFHNIPQLTQKYAQ